MQQRQACSDDVRIAQTAQQNEHSPAEVTEYDAEKTPYFKLVILTFTTGTGTVAGAIGEVNCWKARIKSVPTEDRVRMFMNASRRVTRNVLITPTV
jgi:hypothetical protein